MKPIVIYIGKSDEIKLTKEEFEKYLNEAYEAGYSAGYANGYANGYRPYNPWWNGGTIYTNTPQTQPEPLKITWDTETHPDLKPYITCSGKGEDTLLSHPYVTCDGANDISYNTTRTTGKATFDYKTKEIKNEKA